MPRDLALSTEFKNTRTLPIFLTSNYISKKTHKRKYKEDKGNKFQTGNISDRDLHYGSFEVPVLVSMQRNI